MPFIFLVVYVPSYGFGNSCVPQCPLIFLEVYVLFCSCSDNCALPSSSQWFMFHPAVVASQLSAFDSLRATIPWCCLVLRRLYVLARTTFCQKQGSPTFMTKEFYVLVDFISRISCLHIRGRDIWVMGSDKFHSAKKPPPHGVGALLVFVE